MATRLDGGGADEPNGAELQTTMGYAQQQLVIAEGPRRLMAQQEELVAVQQQAMITQREWNADLAQQIAELRAGSSAGPAPLEA